MAPAFVSGSRRLLAPIFALLVALRLFGWAAPAIAGAITIQYQITGATQDGLPLLNPGGTYMVRVAATWPGMVVSGPATLLTLNPNWAFTRSSLILGHTGSAGLIGNPTYTHRGSVSRSVQGPGIHRVPTTPPGCHDGYNYSGWTGSKRQSARWSGIVGIGEPGTLRVYSHPSFTEAHCDYFLPYFTPHSGTFTGTEISITYVPEPSRPLLTATAILLFAVGARRRLRRS